MTKVAVFGSCVTRDAFEAHTARLGRPSVYFARSWLASALDPRPVSGVDTSTIASSFQQRMVDWDLTGRFRDFLSDADFDVLVIDFIDERFELCLTSDGARLTKSNEFRGAQTSIAIDRVVRPFSDEHYDLWCDAWRSLLVQLDAVGARHRLRVNAVYWASSPDIEFPAMYKPAKVSAANRFLDRIYAQVRQDLPAHQVFTYDRSALVPAVEHKWGVAPFHYSDSYYEQLADHIEHASNEVEDPSTVQADGEDGTTPAASKSPRPRVDRTGASRISAGVRGIARRWGLRRKRAPGRLVISYLYPPTAETSAYVVAKRIREWGVPVDVIASTGHTDREPDPAATEVVGDLVQETIRIPGGSHVLTDWSIIEDFAVQGLKAFDSLQQRGRNYGELYSRSMVPASHVLAAAIKMDHPEKRWIAEFSDPLRVNTKGEHRVAPVVDSGLSRGLMDKVRSAGYQVDPESGMFDLVEYAVYALADVIVFTNEQQRELMLDAVATDAQRDSIRKRSVIWPHPVPDPGLYEMASSTPKLAATRINFAYFGVFFGARSARDLLEAFAQLTADERARVQLTVYADKPRRVRKLVKESSLDGVVRVRPLAPYLTFLNLATKYDWLIVTDARTAGVHTVNPYVPSKLADYSGSGRPIWGLVEEGSLLSKTESITCTPIGDIAASTAFIRSLLK